MASEEKCIGMDCEYFNCTKYIDAMTLRNIPYCELRRTQLKINYEKGIVYKCDKCDPSIVCVNICGKLFGKYSNKQYE